MIKNDKNFYDKTLKFSYEILFMICLFGGFIVGDLGWLNIIVAILLVGMMINNWLYKIYIEIKKKK